MTAKEYLSQLREVKRQQRILQEEIDELTMKAGYGTGRRMAKNISGTSHRCKMEDAIFDKWEREDILEERLAECDSLDREIRAVINAVPDDHYRTILILRYLQFYSWDQIAWDQGYAGEDGMRKLFRHHGKALLMVRIPAKRENTIYCA